MFSLFVCDPPRRVLYISLFVDLKVDLIREETETTVKNIKNLLPDNVPIKSAEQGDDNTKRKPPIKIKKKTIGRKNKSKAETEKKKRKKQTNKNT